MRAHLNGKRPRPRLHLEHLEDRTVPTTLTLTGSTVTVTGSLLGDQININQSNGVISVSGVSQTFSASQVNRIVVDACDGDDTITIGSSVTAQAWIFGGGGNDRITAGGGPTMIYGGG